MSESTARAECPEGLGYTVILREIRFFKSMAPGCNPEAVDRCEVCYKIVSFLDNWLNGHFIPIEIPKTPRPAGRTITK